MGKWLDCGHFICNICFGEKIAFAKEQNVLPSGNNILYKQQVATINFLVILKDIT